MSRERELECVITDLKERLRAFEDLQPVAWTVQMGIDQLRNGMGIHVFPNPGERSVPLFTWEKV